MLSLVLVAIKVNHIVGFELVGVAILNLQKCKIYRPKSVQAEQKHHPDLLRVIHRLNIGQNVFNLLVIYKFTINHSRSPMKGCKRKEKILAAFLAKMLFFFRFFFLNHRLVENRISRLVCHSGYTALNLPSLFKLLIYPFAKFF